MDDDLLGSLGYLALGSRLKRAGALMQAITQRWLAARGCEVSVSHMPFLAALDRLGAAPLGTIVARLGIAQPGVSRMADQLEQHGWIRTVPGESDGRLRTLELTEKGQALVDTAKAELWPIVHGAVSAVCADLSGSLIDQISGLERRLADGAYEASLASMGQGRSDMR